MLVFMFYVKYIVYPSFQENKRSLREEFHSEYKTEKKKKVVNKIHQSSQNL